MPLVGGTRLGAYEIVAAIGAGGMGEVYRAKDTKLGRDVALKILPASFTNDPERVARFRREAQVLASLNHPHIAQIHGLEEVNDTQFLVLELVDGESLDKRIARGPIPVDEALGIAKQIAEALEAAHEKGIIHRDLKPANIALTQDGSVKVLDFGLAKAVEATGGPSSDAMNSPTITSPAMMTGVGVILGTAAYMAPEQAKGRRADKRSDIWAFGCVLFEMLTGKRAFEGEDVSETLAAILMREPAWTTLPSTISPHIQAALRDCLRKERKTRIPEIAVVRFLMDQTDVLIGDRNRDAAAPRRRERRWQVAAGILMITTLAAGGLAYHLYRPNGHTMTRFVVDPPEKTTFLTGGRTGTSAIISPDGQKIAFTARDAAGKILLWVRQLNALTAQPLAGTEDAQFPFWSPDSRFLAFFTPDKLMRIAVSGGPPQTVCAVNLGRGGSWNPEGVIVFGANGANTGGNGSVGLFRVAAAGGAPTVATRPAAGQFDHRFPTFLPDGRHVLFYANATSPEVAGVYIGSLETGESTRLLGAQSGGVYDAGSQRLLFVRQGTLMAQPFSPKTLAVSDEPVPIAERVENAVYAGVLAFSTSETGALAYGQSVLPGRDIAGLKLAWVSREGKVIDAAGPPANYRGIDLSPDGIRIAAHHHDDAGGDIWITEPSAGPTSRLTFDAAQENSSPVWSSDGSSIAFASLRQGKWGIYQKASNGARSEELLLETTQVVEPQSWSPDGQSLVYQVNDPKTGADLWMLPLRGDRKPVPLLNSKFLEQDGQISPDGKWLAYTSTETGRPEIYVRPFPNGGGKWQVSTDSGLRPRWRRDGRELFYVRVSAGGTSVILTVAIKSGGLTFEHGTPVLLGITIATPSHPGRYLPYAVSPDGQRFLISMPPETVAEQSGLLPIAVVINWAEELRRK